MNSGDGWENQCSGHARIPDPFNLYRKQTCRYENIVSIVVRVSPVLCFVACTWVESVEYDQTYKTLVPNPYWPDNGQAQITCNASLVSLVVSRKDEEMFSATKGLRSSPEGSAGMAPLLSCRCKTYLYQLLKLWHVTLNNEPVHKLKV